MKLIEKFQQSKIISTKVYAVFYKNKRNDKMWLEKPKLKLQFYQLIKAP